MWIILWMLLHCKWLLLLLLIKRDSGNADCDKKWQRRWRVLIKSHSDCENFGNMCRQCPAWNPHVHTPCSLSLILKRGYTYTTVDTDWVYYVLILKIYFRIPLGVNNVDINSIYTPGISSPKWSPIVLMSKHVLEHIIMSFHS